MTGSNRWLSLSLLAVFAVIGLLTVNLSVCAQTTPKPSIPEFTLRYSGNSYDVPPRPSTSTNPYTGEITNTTISGYHVDNRTIELAIKNQPFSSYEKNGMIINFYYNVRVKGHYAQNWTNLYSPDNGFIVQDLNSAYTKISDLPYSFGEDILRGVKLTFKWRQ
jgi:hypothetical protein